MSAAHPKSSPEDSPGICAEQMENLLQLQRDALDMVVLGRDTDEILDHLCLHTEKILANAVASIMLFDASRSHLVVRSAPSIPPQGIEALNGLVPGPSAGSCGTAVFSRKPVYVDNISADPRWAELCSIAAEFNLMACWSNPIFAANDAVLGSFALTSFESRPPSYFHKRLLQTVGYLAGIVLEREQQAQRLATVSTAFENMLEGVMVSDADHRIVQVNRAFERITGYSAREAIGQTPHLLNSGRQDAEFYRKFFATLEKRGEWQGEIWNRRKNGEIYPQWLSVKAVSDRDSKVSSHVSVFADITDSKESEHKLWQLAHHDALSNLPNRLLLTARLEHAIQRAHRTAGNLALLFIDLDRFKNINDSLGHRAGDELLQEIADRLQSGVHEDDTVARLGGDEFIVLLEDLPDANSAQRIADRIAGSLAQPLTVRGKSLVMTASIGISLYPKDADDTESLMQHADAAMYRAKAQGRNRIAFYAPELTREIQHRLDLEHDLRRALERDEFELHYQPQFSASDGQLSAVEALVRWRHPTRGLVPPGEFIGVAEESGLIGALGCWVTRQACRQVKAWFDAGVKPFLLAVNLSPYQLRGDCAHQLGEIFGQTGYPARLFEFEVTETLLVQDGGTGMQQLAQMRQHLGMQIAMDDFGTGHSSLSQLKVLPIHKLKIDRSFVADIPDDPNDAAIVKAIILMAHTLGLEVVAEGVETTDQHHFLCDSGCDYLQGFLFGRPVPAEEFSRLLTSGQLEIKPRCKNA